MERANYSLITEPPGYLRVDPLPTEADLDRFYRDAYGAATDANAPDIQRLRGETDEAHAERRWRFETQYVDVLEELQQLGIVEGSALDIGSGTGEFLRFLGGRPAWRASGVERDAASLAAAERDGLRVIAGVVDELGVDYDGAFDLVTAFNVLEHVPRPLDVLTRSFQLLRPGGALVVQVPNDFSLLQNVTRQYLDAHEWWVAIPDHLNYFDFDSLRGVVESAGFEVQRAFGSFPMEFFLIAGSDYLNDTAVGAHAHRRRCAFEQSMTSQQRR